MFRSQQITIKTIVQYSMIAICIMLLISCSRPTATAQSESSETTAITRDSSAIVIDGSSTIYSISTEAASRYLRRHQDSEIVVNFSGTTGGFRRFCQGETDISNASRPISTEEIEACGSNGVEYIEVPIAYDALSIVVHPNNDWVENITVQELKTLWEPQAEGKITQWNQVRATWPDRPINLYGRGKDSGTYDYFTRVIVGQARSSRTDYVASEDVDFLVEELKKDPEGLAFFGIGHYVQNWEDLRAIAVDNGSGPVYPTVDAVRSATYQPLTRPLFLYINADSLENKPQVSAFVQNYLENLSSWVPFVGYIPLSDMGYKLALERFQQRTIGTLYDGQIQTNISPEEMLQTQASLN